MRFRKLPIVQAIRKRMVTARRIRNRRDRFQRELNQIQELTVQFHKWQRRWGGGDETARRSANEKLKELHRRIRKLNRNNHQRELLEFCRKQQIPGGRRIIFGNGRRRG